MGGWVKIIRNPFKSWEDAMKTCMGTAKCLFVYIEPGEEKRSEVRSGNTFNFCTDCFSKQIVIIIIIIIIIIIMIIIIVMIIKR